MGAITIALLGSCLALVVYGVPVFPSLKNSMRNNEEAPEISSAYAGALSADSGLYERVDGYSGLFYYYQAIQIKAHTTGTYTFMSESDQDLVGYFHKDNFDPSVPTEHLVVEDDDSGDSSLQFKIEAFLQAEHTYILVITTHGETETGDFSVVATGPGSVTFEHITPSTSRPILVPSIAPEVKSSHESELTSNSGLFQRVDGDSESFYHYEAIQITVHTTGTYTFMSESDHDLMGYFYKDNFDPSVPTEHLITEDDDSGDSSLQFKVEAFLEAGHTYIIVVTTHAETETGHFSVEVTGPDSVILQRITPSTSRPILAPSTHPSIVSSYSTELSSDSLSFIRPDGDLESKYHYHALEITVSTSGLYEFTSESEMDTIGYLYDNSFEPANPTLNLLSEDDDNGDSHLQFLIKDYLNAGQKYILVVTTHQESAVGSVSIAAKGPETVVLTSISS